MTLVLAQADANSPLGLPMVVWVIVLIAAVLALVIYLRSRRGAVEPTPREPEPKPKPPDQLSEPLPTPLEPKPREPEPAVTVPQPKPKNLADGLGRTREEGFVGRIRSLVRGRTIDESIFDELEEILFTADLGVKTATAMLEALRAKVTRKEAGNPDALQQILKDDLRTRLGEKPPPPTFVDSGTKPYVVMMVGVNGVGKTTTIGKLAKQISDGRLGPSGRKLILGAGDTFRAAAAEQLEIWGQRVGVDVISNKEGTDPSAVAFDAAKAAVARGADILILDTAGRLHTKTNLMEELKKVKRVVGREIPGAPHEVLLVVDATTGQNALNQAKEFHAGIGVNGVVLTKLDGTAKGGIVVAIRDELKIPIRFIGIGEGVEDLRVFDPDAFVDALFA